MNDRALDNFSIKDLKRFKKNAQKEICNLKARIAGDKKYIEQTQLQIKEYDEDIAKLKNK